jgi:hypothetical protein
MSKRHRFIEDPTPNDHRRDRDRRLVEDVREARRLAEVSSSSPRPATGQPVEEVQAPAVSRPRPAPGKRHRSRERRAHLRQDVAGVPCACDDRTPCLAHAGITGRRRHVRPM